MDTLTEAERRLIDWTRVLAAAAGKHVGRRSVAAGPPYRSAYELLLDYGRVFAPRAIAPAEPVEPGQCLRNASDYADRSDSAVVVEGLAVRVGVHGIPIEHAWCSTGMTALDPTWPDGVAYLGIPFANAFRRRRQQTGYWSLLWSVNVRHLLQDGIPADAVADVGVRP